MATMALASTSGLTMSLSDRHLKSSFLGSSTKTSSKRIQSLVLNKASIKTQCAWQDESTDQNAGNFLRNVFCGACAALTLASAYPAFARAPARLPPLSTDPRRCERAFDGNTIGQANGVADKVLDLRFCDFSNDTTNLKGKTLSAALMSDAKFDNADLTEVVMSKAYAVGASFKGTIFTNAVVDRVAFDNSDMRGVQFINTVLSGSTFDGANLEGSSFEDALIGYVDIQRICRNTTLPEEARLELACK